MMPTNHEVPPEQAIQIPSSGIVGDLSIPAGARGVVVFAHGSGSSRFSSRNRFVAGVLQEAGLATLLLDLLTPDEEAVDFNTRRLRFDISLLAGRLMQATEWLRIHSQTSGLPVGYFGASTGAAAALVASASVPIPIRAIVSRGGRPDLAEAMLAKVTSPILLIVGGDDSQVIEMNKAAFARLSCEKKLEIVPGATHLFEEPGTLETVAALASGWFQHYLL
jgi:putative phosphoribosyl transferase